MRPIPGLDLSLPTGFRSLDRPASSELLSRLSYPDPTRSSAVGKNDRCFTVTVRKWFRDAGRETVL